MVRNQVLTKSRFADYFYCYLIIIYSYLLIEPFNLLKMHAMRQ